MFYKLLPSFFIILVGISVVIGSGVSNRYVTPSCSVGGPDSALLKKLKQDPNFNKKKGKGNKKKLTNAKATTTISTAVSSKKDTSSVKPDSLIKQSSIKKNVDLDSVRRVLSLKTLLNDSTAQKKDTASKVSPNAIDEPIKYNAIDSIRFDVESKKVYLYGSAIVKYKEIELRASYIELSLGEDIVYARGIQDSTGKLIGKPQFKEADQSFDAVEITYNFKTKKGLIKQLITKPEDGTMLHSERAKKFEDDVICIRHGKFTTCELEHPHFYIALTKAKVIPDKKIVSGPVYMVVADIPLPLGLPFGFFPNKKGTQSGVLIPEYGEELNRGFFLRHGGYYFAINDYVDLALTGDIYSNLSWGASAATNYRKRYKFGGNMSFKYNENFSGEKTDTLTYQHNKLYAITWQHTQDPKSMPNSSFSANVNASSSSFDRYNNNLGYNSALVFTNQKMSSISYSKIFPNTPFSFSSNLRHSQNSTDSTITLIMPDMNFNMSRIFPFRRKSREGQMQWWENIGFSMTTTLQNKVTTKENKLFTNETIDRFQNGVQHSIPLSTSFKILKYFSFSPSVTYNERWYFSSIRKHWDDSLKVNGIFGGIKTDTVKGYNRVYDYNLSTSLSTTLYGMVQFKKGPIKAIRHVLTPSVSMSWRPDFGAKKYGYFDTVVDIRKMYGAPNDTIYRQYSRFENALYGSPGSGKSGMVSFGLGNNLEMKVNTKDTIEPVKKVKIFDLLSFSTSYNIAADSMKWSPININGSTNLFKAIDLRFNGSYDMYGVDSLPGKGWTRRNEFEMDRSGKMGRLTYANVSVGCNLNSIRKKQVPAAGAQNNPANAAANSRFGPDGYAIFRIPWNLNISYNLRYDKPYKQDKITQTLSLTGNFELTPKWRVSARTDYDFIAKKFVNASVDISRDLHCWEMSFNWVPFGLYKSYFFRINVKSSVLQDLKWERRKNWLDNLEQQN